MQKDNRPKERNAQQALETLQWLCSKMERCESDARRSLYRWHVPREDWDGIIDKLVRSKFIDNERYASCYVRSKISNSGWGVTKIISSLKVKGISKEIIERAIDENVKPEQMQEKLEYYIRARIGKERAKSKNEYDLRCRVFRGAASRGFDFEQINEVIDRYIKDED